MKKVLLLSISILSAPLWAAEPTQVKESPVERYEHKDIYQRLAWIEYSQKLQSGNRLRALYNTDLTLFKAELEITEESKTFTAKYNGNPRALFIAQQAKFPNGREIDHINYDFKPYDRKVCIIL